MLISQTLKVMGQYLLCGNFPKNPQPQYNPEKTKQTKPSWETFYKVPDQYSSKLAMTNTDRPNNNAGDLTPQCKVVPQFRVL